MGQANQAYLSPLTNPLDNILSDAPEPSSPSTVTVEEIDSSPPDVTPLSTDISTPATNPAESQPELSTSDTLIPVTIPEPRRTTRHITQPQRYGFAATTSPDSDHPTYTQAMASPDRAAWQKAMQDEF